MIARDAMTDESQSLSEALPPHVILFIGANHMKILCRCLELSEQITPIMIRRAIDSSTVCKALLGTISKNGRLLRA